MIAIIDNGEDYSDHAIYFVKTDMTKEQVEKLVVQLWSWNENNAETLVAFADALDWRAGWATMEMDSFLRRKRVKRCPSCGNEDDVRIEEKCAQCGTPVTVEALLAMEVK